MRKVIFAIIIVLLVSLSGVTLTVNGAAEINVTIDGKAVDFPDAKPFIDENGRTLIPVRFVTEDLGAKVEWKAELQEVYITKDDVKISVRINDRDIVVNNTIRTMDTKAIIKDSRTYVPIRYVAEALSAKVGWNASTNTVIITTGNIKINSQDFYKINPDMPVELYTYEYRKRSFDGFYQTNKWIVNKYGVSQVTEWMNIAKDYMETCYNVDYKTYNSQEYIESLKWFFMPQTNWYGGDGVKRTVLDYLKYLADMVREKQIVISTKYITDPSLVVTDGSVLVRGRVVYTIDSCNDIDWFNKFFPFGKSEIGKEHARDFEIELANIEQKSGWEHSIYVVYNEWLLSVIK